MRQLLVRVLRPFQRLESTSIESPVLSRLRRSVLPVLLLAGLSACTDDSTATKPSPTSGEPTTVAAESTEAPEELSWARCEAALETLGLTGTLTGTMNGVAPDLESLTAGEMGTVCLVMDGGHFVNVFVPESGPAVVLPFDQDLSSLPTAP